MKKIDTTPELWTEQDFLDGRCALPQVNKPKPESQTVDEVLESLPPATLGEFKQAVLRVARDKHGSYDAFLRAHPLFHEKFLLSMAREPVPSSPADNRIQDIPWLSSNRLAYQRPHQQVISDATIVERPAADSPPPSREKWDHENITDAEVLERRLGVPREPG